MIFIPTSFLSTIIVFIQGKQKRLKIKKEYIDIEFTNRSLIGILFNLADIINDDAICSLAIKPWKIARVHGVFWLSKKG